MRRLFLAIIFFLSMSNLPLQAMQEHGASPQRKYSPVLRFNEDWSWLKDENSSGKSDYLDAIKYISLGEDAYLSFGGHARARGESFSHFGFQENDSSDSYLLTRLFLHADLHLNEYFRIFAEGKNANITKRELAGERRTLDVDSLDAQNLFAEVNMPIGDQAKLTLRGGRQEMMLGRQRLVSPLNWANTRRTFDGGWGIFEWENFSITGFSSKLVNVKKYKFNDSHTAPRLGGIYATGKDLFYKQNLDLYYLRKNNGSTTINTKSGKEQRNTFGFRLWGKGKPEGLKYELEAAFQNGSLGSADISAYMASALVKYRFDTDCSPKVFLGLDYASGDDVNDSNKSKTFSQLYPLGHAYLGYIDTVGRQNIFDIHPGISFSPAKKLKTKIEYHYFRRAKSTDALYNAGGGTVFGAASGSSKNVGSELDISAKYGLSQHFKLSGGYSHFFRGSFVKEALANSKDIDFLHLGVLYIF